MSDKKTYGGNSTYLKDTPDTVPTDIPNTFPENLYGSTPVKSGTRVVYTLDAGTLDKNIAEDFIKRKVTDHMDELAKTGPAIINTATASRNSDVPFKYSEMKTCRRLEDYLASTYSQHYVGENNIQALDIWESLGSFDTSCRDTAIKYLMRYGKKNGKNEADLFKALHYIVLMIHDREKNLGKKD